MRLTTATKVLFSTLVLALTASDALAQTGRQLDVISAPTRSLPIPSQGDAIFEVRPIRGIFWDERCASVEYTFNTNKGANEGTANRIGPRFIANIVQRGLDRWNAIPTSFIEMNITERKDLGNRPRVGGDFINEVTFITPAGFSSLASSPSTALLEKSTFRPGDDLDQDGDSDVFDPNVEGINVCTDIDSDGDIEFPAGTYKAGTILDNDVQFSSTIEWETTPTGSSSIADIDAVSTHEFGHSHGLSHSLVNQISDAIGSGSTMFPFIDIRDANAEIANRSLHFDDKAASSHLYPEGGGSMTISQLQPGDIAFEDAFAIISGTVKDGNGDPITGAAVSAIRSGFDQVASMTYSGSSVALQDGNGVFAFPESVRDGDFSLAVPVNNTYELQIEALDGFPAATTNISTNAIIGGVLGQSSFPQEGYNIGDSNIEVRSTVRSTFAIGTQDQSGIDFVLNEEIIQRNAALSRGLSANIFGASSIRYAERFNRNDVEARLANGDLPFSGAVHTSLFGEGTQTFEFSQGALALGIIDENGDADLRRIFGNVRDILAEDDDLTTIPFSGPTKLRDTIFDAFVRFPEAELFFILDIENVQTGMNQGFPLGFVFVDFNQSGTSFLSIDNGPLSPIDMTWSMELRYLNDGRPVPEKFLQFVD